MQNTTNYRAQEGVEKLQALVKEVSTCLFCTHLKTDDGSTARPMQVQQVDADGNLWFFSGLDSDKNREIEQDNRVQLFFSDASKSTYLVVSGEAKITTDRQKIDELWSPMVKIWFEKGKDDPNISLLKIHPTNAYYWDMEGGKMVNFFKMLASLAIGKQLVDAKEGTIRV